jgi:iron complex transport system substrate-binding protein
MTHRTIARRLPLLLLLAALAALPCSCAPRRAVQAPAAERGAGFPVTLTDGLGTRVTLSQAPRRIVSLAPAATEALFALGLGPRLRGDTIYCDYPAAARSKPKVGGIDNFSVEKVLGLRPDLVVAMPINPKSALASLRRAGVPVFAVDPKHISGVMDALEMLGRITGRVERARALVGRMRQRLDLVQDKLRAVPRSRRPTALLFYQVDPVRVAGGDTFPGDVLERAGGVNLASDVHGFALYSTEAVVARDPQIILAPSMVGDRLGLVRAILARKSLQGVAAVRGKRVYALNADTVDRPGPRIVEGVEEVARLLHPDLFRAEARH